MDEFVDNLLTQERYCDTILPRIPDRYFLEINDVLEPRISLIEEELAGDNSEDED